MRIGIISHSQICKIANLLEALYIHLIDKLYLIPPSGANLETRTSRHVP